MQPEAPASEESSLVPGIYRFSMKRQERIAYSHSYSSAFLFLSGRDKALAAVCFCGSLLGVYRSMEDNLRHRNEAESA
jgi:hypothetical protein